MNDTRPPELRGIKLLHNSAHTKSTAFSEEERDALGLRGLLPANVGSLKTQMGRVLANMRRKGSDIEKYIFLSALQDRNERLFFRLIMENFREIMPLIYTPTVGQACREFAAIYRTEKGFYITSEDRGQIRDILENWPHPDVRIIVITDGERILGLGDLGANGMGIPIGKLSLYCACAGIQPRQCLPVMFDVGTDNKELQSDPYYLGLHQPRIRGEAYVELMDEFVEAANDKFPGVLIQFEDFIADNAYHHLNRYRDKVLCFNDDIQGTAAVVLAGVYASTRISGVAFSDLKFAFMGAGSAASGIGFMIVQALVDSGLSEAEARRRLIFFDRSGLVRQDREKMARHVSAFAHDLPDLSLLDAIRHHQPDILIGATGTPNTFSEEIVRLMSKIKERPGVFALSNPTSRAECTAEQAYEWTDGRAIFASGSPFEPVFHNGQTYYPGQGNNSYIFPGVGLGMLACGAKTIPDTVFLESARALAESVRQEDLDKGSIYPPVEDIRKASLRIATAIATYAYQNKLTDREQPDDLEAYIESQMYWPDY
ncbi:MAG: NAD-dependent malic enzyme [Pseudomonadota bacterium]